MLVFNVAVEQVRATPDQWEMPTVYVQPIALGTTKLRVNVAVYNLTNTWYPTDDEWVEGGPLGTYQSGPVARYNYTLGNLYAFDLTVGWNPAVLQFVSRDRTCPRTTANQQWRSKGILNGPVVPAYDTIDLVDHTYRIGYTSNYPAVPFNVLNDAANVCTLTFTILGAGDYGLYLANVSLVPSIVHFPDAQPIVPWRAVLAPASDPNVGVEAAPRNKDVVGETKAFDTYVLVKNAGTTPQTFAVNVFAGGTQVGTASSGAVAAGSSQTVKVVCSTTGLAKGSYVLKANTTAVGGDTYAGDNVVIQGAIFVTLVGDVDGNRAVNIFDIVIIAGSYGAPSQESPLYNPYADIDNSYAINIFDVVLAAANYGKSW